MIKKITKIQWVVGLVILGLVVYVFFGERIFESKIGKAKMKIFETIMYDEPEEAKENIKNILDTLVHQ